MDVFYKQKENIKRDFKKMQTDKNKHESVMNLTSEDLNELRECTEILEAVEILHYHNKNWLASWTNDPKKLSQEKLSLLKRIKNVIGSSASCTCS